MKPSDVRLYRVVKKNNLAGTFRTTHREQSAMVLCRAKLRMSMNQIAKVFGRSRATVHRYVRLVATNNRRLAHNSRIFNNSRFKHVFTDLKVKMKMFMQGLISFQEAMTMESISVATLDWYNGTNENCSQKEEEDPA